MSRRIRPTLLLAAALAAAPLPADEPAKTPAEHPKVAQALRLAGEWIEAQIAHERLPGVAVGLVSDQELVWSRGLGWADVEAQRPATPVPTNDPAGDLVKLAHVDGNVFHRVRDDGDDLGEEVVFETDAAGEVYRVRWHQNYARKVR